MVCPNCSTENAANARFCIQCGQPLPRVCANCAAINPPGARFCNQCGTPLPGMASSSGPLPSPNGVASSSRTAAPPVITSATATTPLTRRPQTAVGVLPKTTKPPLDETSEQRRIVTVLFADLTSSTALADAMDPEDVRSLLSGFFVAMARAIHRHGGTVEKYIGDAVMAVFGLPTAHEDDPLRAVRAALDMQAALAALNAERRASDATTPELQVRIAINTGEVAAAGAAQEGRDFLITGDPVNTASRMQQIASPGSILVGARTYRSTSGTVRYRKLAPVTLRGKSRPVAIWEVLALTEDGDTRSRRWRTQAEMSAAMIGRDVEMELLHTLFQRVQREHRPHLVTILGAPGIGKTRLAREFTEGLLAEDATATLDAESASRETLGSIDSLLVPLANASNGQQEAKRELDQAPVRREARSVILEGRCPTYGEGITYWPLAEMLRAYCGFTALEPPESARAKLLSCVDEALAAAGKMDDPETLAALLGHTIGIETAERRKQLLPQDGARLQEAMLRAWSVFFEAVASTARLVLWVEDIHWADDPLLDLLEYVATRANGVALLLLCTARPELLEKHSDWGGGRRNYALIALDALSSDDTRALLAQLVPGDGIPEALRNGILDRADGNPFYVEEILRMLVDRRVLLAEATGGWRVAPGCEHSAELADPAIPDTVQGVLLARLDLLDPEERDVLQHASVLGRYFWASALRQLAGHLEAEQLDDVLASLQSKDLIRQSEHAKNGVAPEGETVYTFNHPLTREVTYATIARARRAREHARVAEMLENLAAGREGELAELLALHYLQYYTQAGLDRSRNTARRQAVREKVLRYLTLAGDQAASRQSVLKAERSYTDALELLEAEGEAADIPLQVELHAKRGDVRWQAVDADHAWRDYRSALDLWFAYSAYIAGELAGQPGQAQAGEEDSRKGQALAGRDLQDNAAVVMNGGLTAVTAMLPQEWRAWGPRLCRLLVQLPTRSRPFFQHPPAYEALVPYLEQGLRLAEELGESESPEYAALLTAKAFFWWSWPERRGERELLDALRSAREAVSIMEMREDASGASEALDALGSIQAATTDLRGYLESERRRLRWAERIQDPRELIDIHSEVSTAHQLIGEYAKAIEHSEAALDIAREADTPVLHVYAVRPAVLARFEWDDWAEAARLGEPLLDVAHYAEVRNSDRHYATLLALATIATRTGRRDLVERLEPILSAYTARSSEQQPQFVGYYRARLALARGATREARRLLLDALDRRSGRHSLAAVVAELAELGARTGNMTLYERFAAQALELGWRSGARKAHAQATRARAIVALANRCWEDALCDGETALLAYQTLGTQWEAARTRYVLAGVYLRRGEPDDHELARNQLTLALEAFTRLRAVRDVARARSALASGEVRLP
ncbi:MAG TPA: adenylate/guanylate cyclase domain-containing protein [Ktedonobacterales bacterium]